MNYILDIKREIILSDLLNEPYSKDIQILINYIKEKTTFYKYDNEYGLDCWYDSKNNLSIRLFDNKEINYKYLHYDFKINLYLTNKYPIIGEQLKELIITLLDKNIPDKKFNINYNSFVGISDWEY